MALWADLRGRSWAAARIAQVFGPRMRVNRFLPDTLEKAERNEEILIYGNGTSTVDWVHVDDVVAGLLLAAEHEDSGVFNIASGLGISNLELARRIVQITGSRSPIQLQPHRMETPRRQRISIERAVRKLGYHPRRTRDAGLAEMRTLPEHG